MARGRGERLGPADAWFWRAHSPETPFVVSAALELDGVLPVEAARAAILERLDTIERLRSRVVGGPGSERWVPDDDFDITAHIREGALLDAEAATLWARIDELLIEPFDPMRSPWCFDVLHRPGRGSVLVARLHHAIADGVALMMLMLALTDPPAETAERLGLHPESNPLARLFGGDASCEDEARRWIEGIMPGARRLLIRGLGVPRWALPIVGAKGALEVAAFAVKTDDPPSFKGARVAERHVAWSAGAPLDELERTSHALGVTINDLLLAALSGALRRTVQEETSDPPRDIRVGVPINLRTFERMVDLGNRIGMIYVQLPLEAETPEARLEAIRTRVRRLKRSGQAFGIFGAVSVASVAPAWFSEILDFLAQRKTTAIMTNLPGPVVPLSFAGREITNLVFWVPTAQVGLGLSIFSYAGEVRLGLAAAPTCLADPSALATRFDDELAVLTKLAS